MMKNITTYASMEEEEEEEEMIMFIAPPACSNAWRESSWSSSALRGCLKEGLAWFCGVCLLMKGN